jgi:hypothetical protein
MTVDKMTKSLSLNDLTKWLDKIFEDKMTKYLKTKWLDKIS